MTTRKTSFSCEYKVVACLNDLVSNGGIWEPMQVLTTNTRPDGSFIPAANMTEAYNAWANYLKANTTGVWYDSAINNLYYNVDENAVMNIATPAGGAVTIGSGVGRYPAEFGSGAGSLFSIPYGWIAFENKVKYNRRQNIITHNLQSSVSTSVVTPVVPTTAATSIGDQQVSSPNDIVHQVRGHSHDTLIMQGKGLWIGDAATQPYVPNLASYQGQPLVMVRMKYEGPVAVGCLFDKTVFSIRWIVEYKLQNGYANGLPVIPNKVLCCAKNGMDSSLSLNTPIPPNQ